MTSMSYPERELGESRVRPRVLQLMQKHIQFRAKRFKYQIKIKYNIMNLYMNSECDRLTVVILQCESQTVIKENKVTLTDNSIICYI